MQTIHVKYGIMLTYKRVHFDHVPRDHLSRGPQLAGNRAWETEAENRAKCRLFVRFDLG